MIDLTTRFKVYLSRKTNEFTREDLEDFIKKGNLRSVENTLFNLILYEMDSAGLDYMTFETLNHMLYDVGNCVIRDFGKAKVTKEADSCGVCR